MAKPIDTLLTQWVTPVLRPLGYRKIRRTYRYRDTHGNQAYWHIHGSVGSTPELYQFYLEVGVAPKAQMDFFRECFGWTWEDPKPGIEGWWNRVHPQVSLDFTSQFHSNLVSETWTVSSSDTTQQQLCGQLLAHAAEHWGPRLAELTDPLKLLAYDDNLDLDLDDHTETHLIGSAGAPKDIYLLVDQGPSPRLDQAIAAVQNTDAYDVGEWALRRLAAYSTTPEKLPQETNG